MTETEFIAEARAFCASINAKAWISASVTTYAAADKAVTLSLHESVEDSCIVFHGNGTTFEEALSMIILAHAGFERVPCVVARRAGRPVTIAATASGKREDDEANACLIAAAPEMLDALKDFVSDGDVPATCDCGNFNLTRQSFLRALAVIARAEGRTA